MLIKLDTPKDFLKLPWKTDLSEATFSILYPDGWKGRPFDESDTIHSISINDNIIQITFADGSAAITITNLRKIEIETNDKLLSSLKFVDFEKIIITTFMSSSPKIICNISSSENLQIFGHLFSE